MLAQGKRPRQLHWYHAGPMLFGDWGTSRLYVLGLCFFYTQHASLWFMLAMSVMLLGVGWAYSVVCRLYPDGGGVYSSAKHKSQLAAVIGALLLCADYVVTAAISAVDAFHYLQLPHPELWAAGSIALIGAINILGPTKAGLAALVAAVLTVLFSSVVGGGSISSWSHATVTAPTGDPSQWWVQFTAIILAISGVEAVANMTGIMVEPVAKTARRSIWPVLLEIVVLNIVLTIAMSAVPLEVLGDGNPDQAYSRHRDDMLRLLADYYIGPAFGAVAAVVFALLLLSAVNTSVTDLVSIQYMMSQDRELPAFFTRLNSYGMPAWALLLATGVPFFTVIAVSDMAHLADLYAIGVVGAVTLNLGTCSISFDLPMRRWERATMSVLAALLGFTWVTIAWEKPHALMFAGTIVFLGLLARTVTKQRAVVGRVWKGAEQFWAVVREPTTVTPEIIRGAYEPKSRFLVATRGNPKLLKFALENAREHQAELCILYVKQVAVAVLGPASEMGAEQDAEAQTMFEHTRKLAEDHGVPIHLLYTVTADIPDAILEFAATLGVERVILGVTHRNTLWRTMKGDVIQGVAQHLPERTTLVICA